MTAEEKFYKRAEELGITSFEYTKFGHYGVETDKGVIVLVHESDEDNFTELLYPTMEEISKSKSLRDSVFDQYDVIEEFDNETIGALYRWKLFGDSYELNPYPESAGYAGIYFGLEPIKSYNFKNDTKDFQMYRVSLTYSINFPINISASSEDEAVEKAKEDAQLYMGIWTSNAKLKSVKVK